MALIGLNATLFRAEKIFLAVESRDSSLESSVSSSVLSWCFWDVSATSARLGLMGTKLAFYIFAGITVFQRWNFVLVRNMKLAPRNEFASSNFVGSPYSHTFLTMLNDIGCASHFLYSSLDFSNNRCKTRTSVACVAVVVMANFKVVCVVRTT